MKKVRKHVESNGILKRKGLGRAFCLFCFLFCSKYVEKGSHIPIKTDSRSNYILSLEKCKRVIS